VVFVAVPLDLFLGPIFDVVSFGVQAPGLDPLYCKWIESDCTFRLPGPLCSVFLVGVFRRSLESQFLVNTGNAVLRVIRR